LYAILGQVVAHPDSADDSGTTKDRETLQIAAIAARESLAPVERIEMALHPWVGFLIMPLFALANAGLPFVSLRDLEISVTAAILVGLVIGKPAGILTFCWLAVRMGVAVRPAQLTWGVLAGGSALGGIGFTMALFIANRAFDAELLDSAKMGILLASVLSAAFGLSLLAWFTRRGGQRGVQ